MTFMTSYFLNLKNRKHSTVRQGLLKNFLPLFTLLLVIAVSCSQETSNIGIGLLPDDDFFEIQSTDTIGVRAYTMYNEHLLSSDSTTMIAGSVYDEYFGTTYCDFVTQLRLMTPWSNIEDVVVDSVFLTFLPSQVSGDTLATHYLRICETGTLLTDTTDFYSTQDPDTILCLGEYLLPVLNAGTDCTIKLDNWVGEHLIRDTTKLYPPTEFYKEYFKGIYFSIKSVTDPIIVKMDASMSAAYDPLAITVYYHGTTEQTYFYTFVATHRAVNYNRFTHDRSTAAPEKQILHVNDMIADTAVYLQTYQGVYVKLDLPSLETFRSIPNLAVNKARIIAPVYIDDVTYLEDDLPARIYMRYRDSEDAELVIPDLLHDVTYMDGTYHTDEESYFFNITTFVQQYLQGEIENSSVELFFPLSATQNVIFKANTNVPAIRFEFAYTLY